MNENYKITFKLTSDYEKRQKPRLIKNYNFERYEKY